jgi:hypothetical protein
MATRRCGQGGGCNTPELVARRKREAKESHDAFVAAHIAKKRREEAVEDVKDFFMGENELTEEQGTGLRNTAIVLLAIGLAFYVAMRVK